MEQTPPSLLERLRQPANQAAWAKFVDLYTPLLCCWSRRLGVPRQEVPDLVQDVLLLLLRKLPTFTYDPHQRFRGWLWTVLRNRCHDWRRKQVADGRVQTSQPLPAECAAPDGALALEEAEYRNQLVGRALQLMRTDFQAATWKAFWECRVNRRPAGEVAQELGMSIEAVYAASSRILRRLRHELAGLFS
jgi:RNA polymerase sigma-70 factor (ECF subfamily)